MSEPSKLYAKIATVVASVEQVEKRGHNAHFNYDYATAEDILRLLRKPLAEQNIVLLPSVSDISERPYTTSGGKESVITTVHVDFTFADGETGELFKCSWAGQGDDPADKGLGKAYTNAIKTFLREAFLLPQGDDPEADSETDRRASERKSSGPRAANGRAGRPSDKQKAEIQRLVKSKGLSLEDLALVVGDVNGAELSIQEGWMDLLSGGREGTASALIDRLKTGALPVRTGVSDVPSDPSEFSHPPVGSGEPVPFEEAS